MSKTNTNKSEVSKEDESVLIAKIIDIVMHDVVLRPSDKEPNPCMKREHYCCVVDLSKIMKDVRNKVNEIIELKNS